jgi:type IV secretion system protein VirB10
VERHFWARFGSAILISVIDGVIQAGVEASRSSGSSTVVVSPSSAQGVMTEVLKETASLAPSIRIQQGSPVQVLVARDLDFRSVYALERVRPPAP